MSYSITYREKEGIFYPDLHIREQKHYPLGKYGLLHLDFLKAHRRGTYFTLLMTGELNGYLHKIDLQAKEMLSCILEHLCRERGITEALKAKDGILWAQEMNSAHHDAEETVLNEAVYS